MTEALFETQSFEIIDADFDTIAQAGDYDICDYLPSEVDAEWL